MASWSYKRRHWHNADEHRKYLVRYYLTRKEITRIFYMNYLKRQGWLRYE